MIEKIREVTGLEINARVALFDEVFSKDDEVTFYRVIQECLNNIIKHAGASEVVVQLQKLGRQIILRVQDNGSGFDFDQAKFSGSMGLLNILVTTTLKQTGPSYYVIGTCP